TCEASSAGASRLRPFPLLRLPPNPVRQGTQTGRTPYSDTGPQGRTNAMFHSFGIRSTLAALTVLTGVGLSSAAQAETCSISFAVLKAGWVVGGSGGRGTMRCGGH